MKCVRFSLLLIGLLAAPTAWARVPYPEVELPPLVQEDEIFERVAVAPPQPVGRSGGRLSNYDNVIQSRRSYSNTYKCFFPINFL